MLIPPTQDFSALIRWTRTFVIHFLAKRTLEKQSVEFPDEPIYFPIVIADHPMWTKCDLAGHADHS